MISESEYDSLYEAALLEYKKAAAAVLQDENAFPESNDKDKHHGQQLASSRLILARVERVGVLSQCLHETKSPYVREMKHRVERQMSEEAASSKCSTAFLESFLPRKGSTSTSSSSPSSLILHDATAVDVDAFFEEYPHAMRNQEEDNDEEVDEGEEDQDDEVEFVGVSTKRPASSFAQEQQQPMPATMHQGDIPSQQRPASSSDPPPPDFVRPFQYTAPDTPSTAASVPQAAALQQHQRHPLPAAESMPPPPASVYAPPPANVMAPPPTLPPAAAAARLHHHQRQSWDDHHSQNPFQTAREYAQASSAVSGSTSNDRENHSSSNQQRGESQLHPPNQQPTSNNSIYAPQSLLQPPPPPPGYQGPPVYQVLNPYTASNISQQQQQQQPPPVFHNPYARQQSLVAEAPPPEPQPVIRDSLRRKFQPPRRVEGSNSSGGSSSGQQGTSNRYSNNNGPTGMVRKALNPQSRGGGGHGGSTNATHNGGDGSNSGDEEDQLPEELKRYGKDLVDKIVSEIMDGGGDPVTFQDIAGLEDVKQTVQEVVCWPMKRPDLFTGLRRAPNGLLLYGPPGTGKTLIGKAISHESGATFFSISSSSLTSKWIGEGEKLVRTLFAVAAYREPAVVFIDEIDSLLTQRKADENEASRRIKTEFLVQLDGTGTSGQGRVLVIGATNRPQELDDAARRRFVKRLYIPLPEEADREILLRVLLQTNHHQLTDEEIKKLAKDTAGMSGADLKALSTDAAMGPIRSLGARALEVDASDVPPIDYKHFRMALRGTKPSVSPSDLIQYEQFDKTYGSRRADEELDEDEAKS